MLLFLGVFVSLVLDANVAISNSFQDIKPTTVSQIPHLTDQQLVYLSGHISRHTFTDDSGSIEISLPQENIPQQNTEIIARINHSLFKRSIDIITLTPL